MDYYFGRTYIPPEDVSQRLFSVNLTDILNTLNDPNIQTLIDRTQAPGGQVLVSTSSASDRVAINALEARLGALRGNLTNLNSELQVLPLPSSGADCPGPDSIWPTFFAYL